MAAKRVEDIIPPSRRKAVQSESVPVTETHEPQQKNGRPLLIIGIIIILAILVGGAVAMLFSGARIIVHPMERQVPVNTTFEASNLDIAPLPFDTVRIEKVGTQSVPADGSEFVEERASGTVTIYNEFSSSPQRWVTNTRFEAPNGRIFRVKEPVVIPGMEDGNPGTVDVVIHADEAGAEYNVGLVDFTIPGLAGSPQFESMYARAKTPLAGGFVGQQPVVSGGAEDSVRASMRTALEADLQETIADQIPSGFTLLEGGVVTVFEPISNGQSEGDNALLREKGTAVALVFPTDILAARIAEQTVASYNDDDVTIGETNTLRITNLPSLQELQGAEELNVAIDGTVDVVWKVSAEAIQIEIAGKTREAAETVLSNIPGIERAELILRPFWRNTFPVESEDIQVSISI